MKLYEDLGVERDATEQQIKDAYRRRVKQCHPDLHPGVKEKAAEFHRVQRAYEILSDQQARESYNQTGDANMDVPVPSPERFIAEVFIEGVECGYLMEPTVDVVRELKVRIRDVARSWKLKHAHSTASIEQLDRLQRKIRFNGQGENVLHAALESRLAGPRKDAAIAVAMMKMLERALGVLDLYESVRESGTSIGDLLAGMSMKAEEPPRRRRRAA